MALASGVPTRASLHAERLTFVVVLQMKSHIRQLKPTGLNWEAKANEGVSSPLLSNACKLNVMHGAGFRGGLIFQNMSRPMQVSNSFPSKGAAAGGDHLREAAAATLQA